MASTISAGTTSGTALNMSADTTGNLALTAVSGVIDASATTGALTVPTGTTAQRPATPVNGMTRLNTTLNQFEIYFTTTGWTIIAAGAYTTSYLVVAGGGGERVHDRGVRVTDCVG